MTFGGQRRPNILMITTDHQRADSIGMTQCGLEATPHLNRLAAGSVHLTRAYTTCPLCVPARTAMATGLYPTRNGVTINKPQTSATGKTMHQYLSENGYRVAHFGMNHVRVSPPLPKALSFDRWIDASNYEQYLERIGCSSYKKFAALGSFSTQVQELQNGERTAVKYSNANTAEWFEPTAEKHMDVYFVNEAAAFLRGQRESQAAREGAGPWAMFLNIWAPHPPLVVPQPYAFMFPPDQLELPSNVGASALGEPANRRLGVAAQLAEGLNEEHWRKAWSAHLGLLRLADDGIGRILSVLDDIGAADNTVIMFTSDHGDHLGQHSMYQKMEMYEQAVRVPLLIKAPGVQPGRIDAPVSHLDLLPTMLEQAGLQQPGDGDGLSLASQLNGASEPFSDRPVFMQYSGNPAIGDIRRAIATKRYKYIYDCTDQPELYDLQEDPLEMTNLAGNSAYASIRLSLHQQLADWGRGRGDWVDYSRIMKREE